MNPDHIMTKILFLFVLLGLIIGRTSGEFGKLDDISQKERERAAALKELFLSSTGVEQEDWFRKTVKPMSDEGVAFANFLSSLSIEEKEDYDKAFKQLSDARDEMESTLSSLKMLYDSPEYQSIVEQRSMLKQMLRRYSFSLTLFAMLFLAVVVVGVMIDMKRKKKVKRH